jgi:prolyl-tRNA editing enzyme YbaK/EbsC (Cys-tRNA(Pro) deacylase)
MTTLTTNGAVKPDGSKRPDAVLREAALMVALHASIERRIPAPGSTMVAFGLVKPVVSCGQAAEAKGIPLANELKSLVLATQKGFVVLHLPGDGAACLRRVKEALEIREACLAAPEQLASFGLRPGTVCAVKDPVWSLPHLISRRVFQRDLVSTNDGTLQGYYRFQPAVLLTAASVVVGDFERAS